MSPKKVTKRPVAAAPKTSRKPPTRKADDFVADIGESDAIPYHRVLFSDQESLPKTVPAPAVGSPSLVLYRRIALSFVAFVAIILAVVLYISTMRAEIVLHPVEDTIVAEFLLDVVKTPTSDKEVRGRVLSTTLGRSETIQAEGNQTETKVGKAGGVVQLRNTSNQSQVLVKTTRLLSESGILFRLQKDVTVPAGGSVEAPILADEEGAEGDVGPGRFTIPGLSVSRQAEVYAVSDVSMQGGLTTNAVLSQDQIDAAIKRVEATLTEEAKIALRNEVQGLFSGESFRTEVVSTRTSAEAGDHVASFDVTLNVRVIGVFFDQDAVSRLAEAELASSLGEGRTFLSPSTDSLQMTVEKVNDEEGQANIRVYLDGKAITSSASRLLDPARFVGLTSDEVSELLISDGVAKEVEVRLSPPWVRSVPRLKDHVKILIDS